MTVYIEEVFISNLFMDFFILSLTLDLLKIKRKRARIAVSSFLGATASSIVPVIPSASVWLKIICLIFLPLILVNHKHLKDYFLTLTVFTAVTLLLGGTAFLIKCSVSYEIYLKLTYGIIPVLFSASGIAVLIIVGELKTKLFVGRKKNNCIKRVRIMDNYGQSYDGEGFWDSGNRIYANNGEPVTVVSERVYNRFCGKEESVLVKTVSGIVDLKAKAADLLIYSDSGNNMIYKTKIACAAFLADCDEIILHVEMTEER